MGESNCLISKYPKALLESINRTNRTIEKITKNPILENTDRLNGMSNE